MRIIFLLILLIPQISLAVTLPSISDFFEANKIKGIKLNPTGDKAVIKLKHKNSYILMVMDLESKQKKVVYYEEQKQIDYDPSHKQVQKKEVIDKIERWFWVSDNEIVILLSLDDGSQKDYFITLDEDKAGKLAHELSWINIRGSIVKASHLYERKILVYDYNRHSGIDYFYWDLDSEEQSDRLNDDLRKAQNWVFDKNEKILIGSGHVDDKNTVWYRGSVKHDWNIIWESKNKTEVFKPVLIASDNKSILVLHNHDRNEIVLQKYNPKTRAFGETLFSKKDVDLKGVIKNTNSNGASAVTYMKNGILLYHYFDKETKSQITRLNNSFKNEQVIVVNSNISGNRKIVRTLNHENKGKYYYWDLSKNKLVFISSTEPKLEQNRNLSTIESLSTPTSDGFKIESYLTLPLNVLNPPLVIMPHGGPIGVQDSTSFDPHSQLLVSRGFATLKINYRGSSGYGKKFMFAGLKQWGLSIEKDIVKVIDDVVGRGGVDKNRLCIFGASYGGYSALMSTIKYPNKFKCAISFAGVTDIPLMFAEDTRIKNESYVEALIGIIGDPIKDSKYQRDNSPLYRYKELKTPILLVHGKDDKTVSSEHSERLSLMLNKKNIPHELLLIDGVGHGVWTGKHATILYDKIFEFLDLHLNKTKKTD